MRRTWRALSRRIKRLQWLTDYFGKDKPFKDSALKIIRNKTAFHYDRLNLTEATVFN